MTRTHVVAAIAVVLLAGSVRALEAVGQLKKVDLDAGVVVVFANGQDRNLKISKDLKVLGTDGKDLADGLKNPAFKAGAAVTVTVELGGGMATLQVIRLGGDLRPPQPLEKVDTSKFKPLDELGTGEYQGFKGGFYPDGAKDRPAAHEAAGLALAKTIQPLDADGKPSPDGKIVLLGVGMSNTSQSFQAFERVANADSAKNPKVILVNGAQGGMTAVRIQNPDDGSSGTQFWRVVDERLKMAGVTRAQVQAVWIKQADAGPSQGFPAYAKKLEEELGNVVRLLPARFPNVKLTYLSSRTFGGFAKTRLNPEPYAYESAFSVKWLIESQLKGTAELNFDAGKGKVVAPWLSWGPYLWANGTTKRADGFFYEEGDFAPDGTHQSPTGQRKVGELLLKFFKTDSTTRGWFLARP